MRNPLRMGACDSGGVWWARFSSHNVTGTIPAVPVAYVAYVLIPRPHLRGFTNRVSQP